jgi:RHS repeat-associated protein
VDTVYGAAIASLTWARQARVCAGTTLAYPLVGIDEAGKRRQIWTDGFGRVVEVNEPDPNPAVNSLNLHSCYTYDLLGNLLTVEQRGGTTDTTKWRTRTYAYDALSRVTSASTPETGPSANPTGTMTFYYTKTDGTLCSGKIRLVCRRTDARSITTTYAYDALNRLLSKSYSNGDPTVQYFYDQTSYNGLTITNGKGRRTGMSDVSGTTAWSYDARGRVLTERRTINGSPNVTKSISYTYNLDDSVASITYPSGKVVNYTYSNAARPLSAKDPTRSSWYASDAVYTPHGALKTFKNAKTATYAGVTNTFSFNSRLQPVDLLASSPSLNILDLAYSYGNPNNGNVAQIRNDRSTARTVDYTYDPLNRISSAQTPNSNLWGNNYVYDDWANLLQKNAYPGKVDYENLVVTVNRKNQVVGMTYDLAGNLTNDGLYSYTYNAENQTTTAAGVTYTYDGDNRRVKKSNGKLYWTGMGYSTLAESDLAGTITKEFIYFGGKLVAFLHISSNLAYHYFPDHLGSATVMTNGDGSSIQEESDFYPWGGERVIVDALDNRYKFTTYEWDPESGNHYAVFRQHSSRLGRFMATDPLAGSIIDPQLLNGYSYTRNSPTNLIDPFGLCAAYVVIDNGQGGFSMFCVDPTGGGGGGGFGFGFGGGGRPHPAPLLDTGTEEGVGGGGGRRTNRVRNQQACTPPTLLPHSAGVSLGANLDLGLTESASGFVATGSAGGGVFLDSDGDPSLGGFAGGGAAVYARGHSAGVPPQNQIEPYALGVFGGAGGGIFLSNAHSPHQLGGPFATWTANIGGGQGATVQVSYSNGIWILSITAGPGIGASGSALTTTTPITVGEGCRP